MLELFSMYVESILWSFVILIIVFLVLFCIIYPIVAISKRIKRVEELKLQEEFIRMEELEKKSLETENDYEEVKTTEEVISTALKEKRISKEG